MSDGISAVCFFLRLLLDPPCKEADQLAVDPVETEGPLSPPVSPWPLAPQLVKGGGEGHIPAVSGPHPEGTGQGAADPTRAERQPPRGTPP